MIKAGKFLKTLDQYTFIKQNIKKFAESMDYKQHKSLTQKINI